MEYCITISESHPALAGHFPGNPLVPGVVILDEIIQIIKKTRPNINISGISAVKFIAPLKPEQKTSVVFSENTNQLHFECILESKVIVSGSFKLEGFSCE